MYNHLSSIITFLQDILCIFMSRDNTRNNHVNRERKTNYIFKWYETILISSMIRAVPTTIFEICLHNIKQDCYHAWYVLLEQHCSRLLVQYVLFEQTWTTLLTTMFTGCSTTLFTPVPNSTVYACWQLAAGCAFLRVYYGEVISFCFSLQTWKIVHGKRTTSL